MPEADHRKCPHGFVARDLCIACTREDMARELAEARATISELEADVEYYRGCGCDTCVERFNRRGEAR